jgi:hypothetical protein
MKKNAQNKLKLDKKTVSKLNSTEASEINGGKNTLYLVTLICMTYFCPPPPITTVDFEVIM